MTKYKIITLVALLGCFVPALMVTNAQANIAEADSILTRIGLLQNNVRELSAQLPGISGEDSLIIQYELDYARLKTLDQVFLLIDFLADNKESHPIRPQELAILDKVAPSIVRVEDTIVRNLKDFRPQRKNTQASLKSEFETNLADFMNQQDVLQGLMFKFVKALEKLDLPAAALENHLQENIKDRTRILIGRLRISLKDKRALDERISLPASGDDAVLLRAAQLRVQANVKSLRHLISLMKKLSIDTTSYEAFLIESTGELTTSDLSSGALGRFLNNWFQKMLELTKNNGLDIVITILMILVTLVGFHYLGALVSKIVIASIDASKFKPSRLLRNMIDNMTSRIIMLIGIFVALSQLGISLGPMLAGLGVAGFIVGFALQDTLANFASGIMILLYRPFDVGDMVETGTVFGQVKHMSLVSTVILTIDNQTLVVPNNMIWGNVIKNVTAQNVRRVDLVFGISYTDDIPKVEKLLMAILEEHDMILKRPAPMVKLHELGDSSVDFVVRPWVRTADYWDVHWDITREVKMRFDAEGISIPFPQQDVHLYEDKAES